MREFKDVLRQLRQNAGMTQAELGKKLGIAKTTVSSYELGTREPSFEMEEAIADLFNVDLLYLRGKTNITTEIVTDDAHMLIEIYKKLDAESQSRLLGYARGLEDLKKT